MNRLFESLTARKVIKLIEKVAPIHVTFLNDLAPRCPVCGRFTKKGQIIWNDTEHKVPSTCISCYDDWKDAYFERLNRENPNRVAIGDTTDIKDIDRTPIWNKHPVPKIFNNDESDKRHKAYLEALKDMPDTDIEPKRVKDLFPEDDFGNKAEEIKDLIRKDIK